MRHELKSIIKRRERFQAEVNGYKHYFTGRPCKHGHVAKRRTEKGDCTECRKVNHKREV